jgi:hypothetical protein
MGYGAEVDRSQGRTRAHRTRRQQLGIPEEKTCKRCGQVFTRSEVRNTTLAHWLSREHCSFECAHGPAPQERFCEYWKCWKLFTPLDNDPDNRFHSRECAQRARRDRGDMPAAFLRRTNGRPTFMENQPGDVRRVLKLKMTKSDGRPTKWHPETAALVVTLRDSDGLSWGEIMAETGLPKSTARSMYDAAQKRS